MNDLDAITKACEPVLPPSDPGYTTAELAVHWSKDGRTVGVGMARKRIKAAIEAGRLVTGRRWRVDAAGRVIADTVYRAA